MDDSSHTRRQSHIRAVSGRRVRSRIRCRWSFACRTRRTGRATSPCFAPFHTAARRSCRGPIRSRRTRSCASTRAGLIRVLGDDGAASGAWQPQLSSAAASQRAGNDAASAALRCADDRDAAARAAVVLRVRARAKKRLPWPARWRIAHDDMLFPELSAGRVAARSRHAAA